MENTILDFAAYYETQSWGVRLLQGLMTNATIRQAVISLGAVHRAISATDPVKAGLCLRSAERSYIETLGLLRRSLSTGEVSEVSMPAAKLLATFEAFRGNYEDAVKHLSHGLKVLFSHRPRCIILEAQVDCPSMHVNQLLSLNRDCAHLLQASFHSGHEPLDLHVNSLSHVQNWLFKLLYRVQCSIRDSGSIALDHQQHAFDLFQWDELLLDCIRHKIDKSSSSTRWVRMLRLSREAVYVLLLHHAIKNSCLMKRPNTLRIQSKLQAHFSKLYTTLNPLSVEPDSKLHCIPGKMDEFSFVNGLIKRPSYAAPVDRLPTRRAHAVAGVMGMMEETAARLCSLGPQESIWIDLANSIEEETPRLCCLTTNPDGSLVWMQEYAGPSA